MPDRRLWRRPCRATLTGPDRGIEEAAISELDAGRRRVPAALGRRLATAPAPGLVVGGMVGLQAGAALTTRLYPAVGPGGVVTLRLGVAAAVLLALWRPGPRWDR